MPKLLIQLFGQLLISINGKPAEGFDSQKSQALLVYLAVEHQHIHRREILAEMFWPGKPEGQARQNLRQALSNVRKVIGDRSADIPYLLVSKDDIQFNVASDIDLDCFEFEKIGKWAADLQSSQIESGIGEVKKLKIAAGLYQGEFLRDFYLSDCPAFLEWISVQRERYRRMAITIFQQLVAYHESNQDFSNAEIYARRWSELDQWGENTHRQLMRILVLQGKRNEALKHYHDLQKKLSQELDLEPTKETTNLFELIQGGLLRNPSPLSSYIQLSNGNDSTSPVFVARKEEIGVLQKHLSDVLTGNGKVFFIKGDIGQGKTSLIKAFSQVAMDSNPTILTATGHCNAYSGIGDPYLPFRDILGVLTADLGSQYPAEDISVRLAKRIWKAFPIILSALLVYGSDLLETFIASENLLNRALYAGAQVSNLLDTLEERVKQIRSERGALKQFQIYEQYTNVLRKVASSHPLVLIIEDIHWADTATISMLFHLGQRIAGSRILILCSYREEEIIGSPGKDRPPLQGILAEFKRQYGDVWLDLDILDEQARCRFVNDYIDTEKNDLSISFRENLYHHTRGRPLFTIELLNWLKEQGKLVKDEKSGWRDLDPIQWNFLPAKIEGVIEMRLGSLSTDLYEILSIASVEGETFIAQVVAGVLEIDEMTILQKLSQVLERKHRLVLEEGEISIGLRHFTRFRFSHILFHSYLYKQINIGERRLLHGKVAAVLEQLKPDDHEALAFHYLQAKKSRQAIKYLILAGEAALNSYANKEAEGFFKSAIDLGPTKEEEARILYGLGESLSHQGLSEEAINIWQEGLGLILDLGDPDQTAKLFFSMARVYSFQGDWQDALGLCRQGLAIVEGSPPSKNIANLLFEAARACNFLGLTDDAEMYRYQTQDIAERVDAKHVQASLLSSIWMGADRPLEILERMNKSIEIAKLTGDINLLAISFNNTGVAYSISGYLERGKELFRKAEKLYLQAGNRPSAAFSLSNLIYNYIHQGNLHKARELVGKGWGYLGSFNNNSGVNSLHSAEAYLAFAEGDLVTALDSYQILWDKVKKTGDRQSINEIGMKMGWLLLELGENQIAGEVLQEAIYLCGDNCKYVIALYAFMVLKCVRDGELEKAHSWMTQINTDKSFLESQFPFDTVFLPMAKAVLATTDMRWENAFIAFEEFDRCSQEIEYLWGRLCIYRLWADAYVSRGEGNDIDKGLEMMRYAMHEFERMGALGWSKRLEDRIASIP